MSDLNLELADFLRRARNAVDPSRVLPSDDARARRVPGLRREEVANLARVSPDYYARLEQGRRITPSIAVVNALASALGLDDAGRSHLRLLVGLDPRDMSVSPRPQVVRPAVLQLMVSLHSNPAVVLGRRMDVLATNRMARLLFGNFDRMRSADRNYARWMLIDPAARKLFVDWEVQAQSLVEALRLELARYPEDPVSHQLVRHLRDNSPEFGDWWDAHPVGHRSHGTQQISHPVFGEVTLEFERLVLPADPDQTLLIHSTRPASSSRRTLDGLLTRSQGRAQGDAGSTAAAQDVPRERLHSF